MTRSSLSTLRITGSNQTRAARWAARFRGWAIRFDVVFGILAVMVLTTVVGRELYRLFTEAPPVALSETKGLTAPLMAAWAAVVIACIGGAVKVTSARQNLIRLLSSEIRAIQYGLTKMNMFDFWLRVHADPEKGAMGFANTPRTEDYFAIFHAASGTIVNQHPLVVESVVRFYTYFKMSRDAAAALGGWEKQLDPEERKRDVEYVVRLLSLAMFWGYAARFSMGHTCDPDDVVQLDEIKRVMNGVLKDRSYEELCTKHPRAGAIKQFFYNDMGVDQSSDVGQSE
jgi:hypothetical protein